MKRALMSAAVAALCLLAACDDRQPPERGNAYAEDCGTFDCREDELDAR